MAELSQSEALERAQAAAQSAREAADHAQAAADAAQSYADQIAGGLGDTLADVASAATGGAIDPFVFRLSIFVLAIFVGYYVVWSVTPALHTPLMSVTNAISSVIVVGALLAVGVDLAAGEGTVLARAFGFIALVLASVNIFGGFLVTQRMLAMYKKKQR
ncbi:NAD(P) transhydrogenase subunit alpha [Stappia sp. F7233]|uniref:proton-translocating NAD(P)(+) transhydrogenase n=1 Tax=Stappia albiluteola TaxID=2758565 RepID=A0A839AES8_9HYPH|nr:NAD(P) transhydrogenase subunit alpha [Stappia albiluteola]MBA5777307.1 NAD(P) transhydrogenase subunit alpha [Stappia albiluteola]